jgi:hypothetical protein
MMNVNFGNECIYMAPFRYMLKAPSVSNLDVIEHITVYLTDTCKITDLISCPVLCGSQFNNFKNFHGIFLTG